jgi:glycosyltransferase involved in cell wall biosynthesis
VASRIAGVPTLVRHEKNGLLVEPGDAEALAAALGRLLRCEHLRHEYAAAGRRTIEESFSFEHRMRRIVGIYDGLLERGPTTDPAVALGR